MTVSISSSVSRKFMRSALWISPFTNCSARWVLSVCLQRACKQAARKQRTLKLGLPRTLSRLRRLAQ